MDYDSIYRDILSANKMKTSLFDCARADREALKANIERNAASLHSIIDHSGLVKGWTKLLDILIELTARRVAEHSGERVRILSCKEKFGVLQFHTTKPGDVILLEELNALSRWATEASKHICAVTGKAGRMTSAGWIIPLSAKSAALKESNLEAFRNAIRF